MNLLPTRSLEAVRQENLKLGNAVSKMLSDIYHPDIRVVPASYETENGSSERFVLVQGVWVETYPGLRMMMVDDMASCQKCSVGKKGCSCTRILCEATDSGVMFPRHYHLHDETITVISGEVIEHEVELPHPMRRPADRILYPSGQWHKPEIRGLVMICWQPPLESMKYANPQS